MHIFDQANLIAFHRLGAAPATPAYRLQGWRDLASQQIRFAQLLRLQPTAHSLVLDVGCGLGDLFHYLQQQQPAVVNTQAQALGQQRQQKLERSAPVQAATVGVVKQQQLTQQQKFDKFFADDDASATLLALLAKERS